MSVKEMFFRYMKSLGIEHRVEELHINKGVDFKMFLAETPSGAWFDRMCCWASTIEGHDYWADINAGWQQALDSGDLGPLTNCNSIW
jgi:hypothetical protein